MVRGPRVWPMSEEQNAAAPIQNDSETIPARLPRQRQFNNHQPPSSGWLPPLCAGILIEPSTRSCGEFFLTRGKRHPLILITIACCFCRFVAFAAEPSVQAPTGLWDGSMQSRVGEVSFGIDLKAQGRTVSATLVNATDRQPFSSGTWDGHILTLRLDYYDGQLVLHYVSPERMEGEYSRQTSKGMVHIPVTLVPHHEVPATKTWAGPSLTGDWILHEAGAEGAEKDTLTTISAAENGHFRWQSGRHGNHGTGQRRQRLDAWRGLNRSTGQTRVFI